MQYGGREASFRTHNWKSDEVTVADEGTYWLVKSDEVHIQARYWKNVSNANWTNLGSMAVGGPFLKGNTFVIRPLSGKVTWNGEEVLSNLGSEFSNDLIHAKYHKDAEIVKDGRRGIGIEVELPHNVKLMVNRWQQGLAAKITMCALPKRWEDGGGGQDGQCGNFNQDPKDDTQEVLMARAGRRIVEKDQLEWRTLAKDQLQMRATPAKAKPSKTFALGDRVKVRDTDTEEWKFGRVTKVTPLKVLPDYYDVSFPWEYVERVVAGNEV